MHSTQTLERDILFICESQADEIEHHGLEEGSRLLGNTPLVIRLAMATQRLRRKLERDGVPEHINLSESFCRYGTPLPALSTHRKDRNEYKPLWEQEVYDERGRRRFHGAFTGGFSAGYFNTVGSKEGWTPSSFRSSRTSRGDTAQIKSRPEDFMDDEDLAERDAAVHLGMRDSAAPRDPLLDMLTPGDEPDALATSATHTGQSILRRMGWKPGQGIGPLVTYEQRVQLVQLLECMHLAPPHSRDDMHDEARRHKFPPPDTQCIRITDNRDRHGLGAVGTSRSSALSDALAHFHEDQRLGSSNSDDEEPAYGSSRLHELASRETLVVGEAPEPRPSAPQAMWRDGRPLIEGFVCGRQGVLQPPAPTWSEAPSVPPNWLPDPRRVWAQASTSTYAQPIHAGERGTLLGEVQRPGPPPAISAYLSAKAQERMLGTSKAPPPEALTVHKIDTETAKRALDAFRSTNADPAKEARYRAYLYAHMGGDPYVPLDGPLAAQQEEVDEFFQSASRHRPVHGAMATRFTASTVQTSEVVTGGLMRPGELVKERPADATPMPTLSPAQQAAREEKYGPLTRTVEPFYPPRLLCKRLGIADPHPERETEKLDDGLFDDLRDAPDESGASEFVAVITSDATTEAQERELQEAKPPLDLFKAVFEDDEDEAPPARQVSVEPYKRSKSQSDSKRKKARARSGPLTFDMDDA